jgi:geranyl-CoA carboxylase alpha subunit
MRSVRKMGLRCVAVYSDADADSPHVQYADEAVCIGPGAASASYLLGERIIEAALATGAGAIHPGYGFLSENAGFAHAVSEAGLVFVGPSPEAIEIMGDKAVSKRAMLEAGIPCIAGYQDADQSTERLLAEAERIGFPLMIKAAAGGGGRGMRRVDGPEQVAAAIERARSEAQNAFGSGDLILEQAVIRPRHVEVQVFADTQGNVIHLGERDCSVQRRHQKVVEESPCPVMTDDLRERMGRSAVDVARAVGYVGAGTVEFLLDENGAFYFLEMNTRLQVEHPVTEMVTGLDLVQLQLEVAQGMPLPLEQTQVALTGHAIEVRLYAEDPAQDFLPCTGAVNLWRPPRGEGIRVDAGIATGGEVSPFYDSMVAKIIASGDNRNQAIARLRRALEQTVLLGPVNNRDFLIDILDNPVFGRGEATTAFIEEQFSDGIRAFAPQPRDLAGAAVIHYQLAVAEALGRAVYVPRELAGWDSAAQLSSVYRYSLEDGDVDVSVTCAGRAGYRVAIAGSDCPVEVLAMEDDRCRLRVDGRIWSASFAYSANDELTLSLVDGGTFTVRNVLGQLADAAANEGGPLVEAPMQALVVNLAVAPGDVVKSGDVLMTLEAMKMQHDILAPLAGTVAQITAQTGEQVSAGQLLLELQPDESQT